MRAGHADRRRPPAWGEPAPGLVRRWIDRARVALQPSASPSLGLRALPVALRRGELAQTYLRAAATGDHRRAAAAAVGAMERAVSDADWWPADVWAHRALWHFEQSGLELQATRQARRIGDLRSAAGDPASARRYYAEAIDEARDIGAEHEQGLAALGLGRALLDLGEVATGRRMAGAAVELLVRAGAPADQVSEARRLLGTERAVGEKVEEDE